MLSLLGAICACQLSAADSTLTASRLVELARTQRYYQDSTLADYQVIAKQRWTGGIGLAAAAGLGPMGRTRLAARFESVARMNWDHRHGAWGELIAGRGVAPIAGEMEVDSADDDIVFVLPYSPGQEQLWPLSELREALPGRDWISHPLEHGADSLYRYALGSSLDLTLPSSRVITLRELIVQPRRPDERLIVGSMWIDVANGALVRAAYRPSIAVDLWPLMEGNFDGEDRDMIQRFGPFRGNVEEVVIEYGLFGERFWLPRLRIANAEGTAKGGRVTITIEQSFEYERVRAVAAGERQAPPRSPLSRAEQRAIAEDRWLEYEGGRRQLRPCREQGDTTDPRLMPDSIRTLSRLSRREVNGVEMRILLPCDQRTLTEHPALPPSIYSPSEELFTDVDLERLRTDVSAALAMSRQAEWEPQRATVHYGLDRGLLRFNRIEGLSAGVASEKLLGRGYTLNAAVRLGIADLEPNADVTFTRASGHATRRLGVYRRLDFANEWGNPIGLPASIGALLLGRDDGIFFRTLGAEVGGTRTRVAGGTTLTWRLFAEQHRTAVPENTFSFARVVSGTDFLGNIAADEGEYYGGAGAIAFALGLDPTGTQFSGTFKAEAADGEKQYGRALTELRLARGLGQRAVASITGATGTSTGAVPTQRLFYLGGPQTLHAHRVGSASGNAFWFARAELTRGWPMVRPTLFADLGWAGSRANYARSYGERAAVGIGIAAMDGLFRIDVSRAVRGGSRTGFDIFVDVR